MSAPWVVATRPGRRPNRKEDVYETTGQVHVLPYFIEEVYNRKWLHSALDYRPLKDFEELPII